MALYDFNQRHLCAFLEQCGLKTEPDAFGCSDLVDDPESQEHQCFRYSGVIDLLSKIVRCNQDIQDIAELAARALTLSKLEQTPTPAALVLQLPPVAFVLCQAVFR